MTAAAEARCEWCDPDPWSLLCRACGRLVVGPMSPPQEEFLATEADIAFYGGQAGGGKTWMLAMGAGQFVDVPGYASIIFRRTSPELVGGGSIWEATKAIYPHLGGVKRTSPNLDWSFPSTDAMVELRHLQHEDDVEAHQGKQYAFVGFDEVTHFTAHQFWYLVSRLRSTSGVKPHLRATCNPDPDSFVRELVAWWIDPATGLAIESRSGVLRWFARDENDDSLDWGDTRDEVSARNPGRPVLSCTFIPARLIDNPVLLAKDPSYVERLGSLPKVERERLLGGNWNIKPAAGEFFKRSWFTPIEADEVPLELVVRTVRCWDKAASEVSQKNPDPDWTRGLKVSRLRDGRFVVWHLESLRGRPAAVDAAMKATAQHDGVRVGVVIWQDPGQAGVVDVEHVATTLAGFSVEAVKASKDKESYARPMSSMAERGRILVVKGSWNAAFFAELEAFPTKGTHDDIVDVLSLAGLVLAGVEAYGYTPARQIEAGESGRRNDDGQRDRGDRGMRGRGGLL